MNAPVPSQRPLLVIFHCGAFFLVYAVFMMSIGRRDVEQMAVEYSAQLGDDYIRNMLILLSGCFIGYIGLWNMRRWGLILLSVGAVGLLAYAATVGHVSLPFFLPLVAALTTAPLWPMMKR